jgi:hypothetical protein
MRMIRRSRLASVAGMVAMILVFLVLCPCAPAPADPSAAGNDHACCGANPGLTAAVASCCTSHDEGTQAAVSAAGAAIAAPAWVSLDAVPVTAPTAVSRAIYGHLRPPAATLILRI